VTERDATKPGRVRVQRGRPAPRHEAEVDAPVEDWVRLAARAARSKTDDEIVALQVAEVLAICDWFLVCSGSNPRQVRTVTEEVERQLSEAGGPRPRRVEGLDHLQWVLMDYGDFVVHVFHEEARRFYELERLWADVPRLRWAAGAEVEDPSPQPAAGGQ
jgi:ribosome-associated protein